MQGIRPFVAEDEGHIVGYADIQPSGYIDHFFVAGGHARRYARGRFFRGDPYADRIKGRRYARPDLFIGRE
jgi:hypothetical protein